MQLFRTSNQPTDIEKKGDVLPPILSLLYQTFDVADYQSFWAQYAQRVDGKIPDYFPVDFGKPGMGPAAQPNHTEVTTALKGLWKGFRKGVAVVLAHLSLPNESHEMYGAPESIWLQFEAPAATVNAAQNNVSLTLLAVNKTATRLPESLWLRFQPPSSKKKGSYWVMDKLGEDIRVANVVTNGSSHLHAVWTGVKLIVPMDAVNASIDHVSVALHTLDAPVISVGDPWPFPTFRHPGGSPANISASSGISVNLVQNIWGTNYIMWYPFLNDSSGDQHLQYRFSLHIT